MTPQEIKEWRAKYYMKKANHNRIYGHGSMTITFEEWMDLWITSGRIPNSGNGSQDYVMTRIDESLPLSRDNAVIKLKHDVIVAKHRGRPKNRGTHINQGIKRSDETRERQRLAHLGSKPAKAHTPIHTPAGDFTSIRAAAEHYGITVNAIHYFKKKYPDLYYYLK